MEDQKITRAELKQRLTGERTGMIALGCLFCENIDVVDARFVDGHQCSVCGKQVVPIGYLKPNRVRKKPTPHEGNEQEALFRWTAFVRGRFPEIDLLYHIPNGGSRNRIEAAKLKRQGVKAGVPDLCLPVARANWHGLYIEMKAGKNTPTKKQKEWISALRGQGYAVEVCYGWERATEVITEYLESGVASTEEPLFHEIANGKLIEVGKLVQRKP